MKSLSPLTGNVHEVFLPGDLVTRVQQHTFQSKTIVSQRPAFWWHWWYQQVVSKLVSQAVEPVNKRPSPTPRCTEWSPRSADPMIEAEPMVHFLHCDPGCGLAEESAFGRQIHQWLPKSSSQFPSEHMALVLQTGSADPLAFSGGDGEVWGKKTTQVGRFPHRVLHVDAPCSASLLHGQCSIYSHLGRSGNSSKWPWGSGSVRKPHVSFICLQTLLPRSPSWRDWLVNVWSRLGEIWRLINSGAGIWVQVSSGRRRSLFQKRRREEPSYKTSTRMQIPSSGIVSQDLEGSSSLEAFMQRWLEFLP